MKKVDIKNYEKTNTGTYRVFSAFGKSFEFPNVKATKAFLHSTNEFLTFQLYELRDISLQLSTMYHELWPYLQPYYKDAQSDRVIRRNLADVDECYQHILHPLSDTSGNWISYQKFYVLSGCLSDVIEEMEPMAIDRKNYHWKYKFKLISIRIANVISSLEMYSPDYATFLGGLTSMYVREISKQALKVV